jgi:hypothetical protein
MSKAFFANVDAQNATTRYNLVLLGTFGYMWSFEAISKKLSFSRFRPTLFIVGETQFVNDNAKRF